MVGQKRFFVAYCAICGIWHGEGVAPSHVHLLDNPIEEGEEPMFLHPPLAEEKLSIRLFHPILWT